MLQEIFLFYLHALLMIGAAPQNGGIDSTASVILNSNSVQLVVESQCATAEKVKQIVEEACTTDHQCATKGNITNKVCGCIKAYQL